MSKKQIPKRNEKRTNTLLTPDQDEDLRKSLSPLTFGDSRNYTFTKFVKFKDDRTKKSSDLGLPTNTKVKFYSDNEENISKQRTGTALFAQYRDKSFLIPDSSLSWIEKLLSTWNSLFVFIFRENQGESKSTFAKNNIFLLVWNLLVILCYLYNIFEVPVALFFTEAVYKAQTQTSLGLGLNWLFISLILVNIILVRPNTQFQKLGYLINNRIQIMQDYFGYKLIFDLVGVVILIIYIASGNPALVYLKIFFYSNIVTLMHIDQNVRDKLELHPYAYAVYRLMRLELIIVFVVLWLSSIFFGIDYYFYRYGPWTGSYNWLTSQPCTTGINSNGEKFNVDIIVQYPWYIWLNYAAYWCLQTISTVGYGDFTPRNPPSVVFTNVTILMVVFFFVLFINSVIEIIDEMTSAEEKQRKTNLKMFKQYYLESERKRNEISIRFGYDKETIQKNQKLAEITADNIRSFLYEMDLNNLLEEEDDVEKLVYNNLTEELREELFLNYRQQFFKKVLLFGQISGNSNNFLEVYQQLIYKIKEVPYGSGEIVYADEQDISHSLYFLLKGNVMLKYPLSKYTKLVENIQQKNEQTGNYYQHHFLNFGVREFFTRQPKDHLAVTMSYCKIQMLSYEDFMDIIKSYPSFYYKYCELRDTITIFGNNKLTGEECFECHSKDHHLFSCYQCNFNITFNTWRTIRSKGPIPKRGAVMHNEYHQRKAFFRDPVVCHKINTNKPLGRKVINLGLACHFDEYFPSENLKVYTRQDD